MRDSPPEFVDWLKGELESRNLGIREGARLIGISHPTLSDIVTNGKRPSFETCIAIASAFQMQPEKVLRLSGLLPKINQARASQEDWEYLLATAHPEDRETAMVLLRALRDRRAKR